MDRLSSISVVTLEGDHILLAACRIKVDPLRVLLLTEDDFREAMTEGSLEFNLGAMPLLSAENPTAMITPPKAGQWRIVYQAGDADAVTAAVIC